MLKLYNKFLGVHMKKSFILPFVLVLCLFLSGFALAQGDNKESLASANILPWVRSLEESTSKLVPNKQPKDKDDKDELGYAFFYDYCTLYYSMPNRQDGKLLAIVLNDSSVPGPRNELCYDEVNSLLAKYPNDNKMLVGDRDLALLYQEDRLPESAYWAYVSRDGQRISSVEYYINELLPNERYSNIKLSYSIIDGRIDSIGVYGLEDLISKEEVQKNLEAAAQMRELKGYFQYKTSTDGSKLDMFEREDLLFSDLDFLSLSPEMLVEKFGNPDSKEKIEDEDGKYYMSLRWSGIEANFLYNAKDELLYASKLLINDDILEGPRGSRIGDGYPLVYSRFRSGLGQLDENYQEILYGNKEAAPYGIVNYLQDAKANMQMAIDIQSQENTQTIVLELNFDHDVLDEIVLYVKE